MRSRFEVQGNGKGKPSAATPIPKSSGLTAIFPPVSPLAGTAFQKMAQQNLRLLAENDVPQQGWERADLSNALRQLPIETRKVVLGAGEIDGTAEPLLSPAYDQMSNTYQRAQGFVVPVQVVFRMKCGVWRAAERKTWISRRCQDRPQRLLEASQGQMPRASFIRVRSPSWLQQ